MDEINAIKTNSKAKERCSCLSINEDITLFGDPIHRCKDCLKVNLNIFIFFN